MPKDDDLSILLRNLRLIHERLQEASGWVGRALVDAPSEDAANGLARLLDCGFLLSGLIEEWEEPQGNG